VLPRPLPKQGDVGQLRLGQPAPTPPAERVRPVDTTPKRVEERRASGPGAPCQPCHPVEERRASGPGAPCQPCHPAQEEPQRGPDLDNLAVKVGKVNAALQKSLREKNAHLETQRVLTLPTLPQMARSGQGLARSKPDLAICKPPKPRGLQRQWQGSQGFPCAELPCAGAQARVGAGPEDLDNLDNLAIAVCDDCARLVDDDYCLALILGPAEIHPTDAVHYCAGYEPKGAGR
jgi:hypothetical protein